MESDKQMKGNLVEMLNARRMNKWKNELLERLNISKTDVRKAKQIKIKVDGWTIYAVEIKTDGEMRGKQSK